MLFKIQYQIFSFKKQGMGIIYIIQKAHIIKILSELLIDLLIVSQQDILYSKMPPKKNAKDAKLKAKEEEKKKPASNSKAKQPTKVDKSSKVTPPKPVKSVTPPPKQDKSKAKNKKDKSPSPQPKRGKNSKSKDADPQPVKKTKSEEQIVTVITKGGAAVDSLVPNKDEYRVLQDGGKNYSATLNQANMDHNNNKFYIIQILQHQKTGNLSFWNRWGRVGVPGQNVMKPMANKQIAINQFNKKHHQKTKQGDYTEIQIKYDDEAEEDKKKPQKKGSKNQKVTESKLDKGLQKLISLIFDVQVMNNTMKQIGYDAKKMPLGRLGDSTIKQAYTVLAALTTALKEGRKDNISTLSGKFYSLIPHDFGFQKMSNFILDNEEKVKNKISMLETISDMKITTKLLDQKNNDETAILDQNYKKLGCNIKTVDQKSPQYKLLHEYMENTKGHYSKVKVGQIYEVCRENEQKNYNQKLGNNMLLWHGSGLSNFVGILSQGLRIAPPEAPVSGYNFGKGIYLADMAEKSIGYCRAYGSSKALILLIEGAIGNPNILTNCAYNAKQLMESNKKDSTKCHGAKAPPPESYVKHKNFIVPKGVAQPTKSGSYMGHNEYIVYNMNQARIRYLIQMDMNGS